MSEPAIEPTPATDPVPAAATPAAPQEPAAAAPEPAKAAPANLWDDPKAAQAEIERLRRENAKDRTNAKAAAADEARKELAQSIGKALGLVKDEPVDPTVLTDQLTKAQAEQRQAALELAVFKATPDADVAKALLDSRSFLAKVAEIDPTDTTALVAAVGEAVLENPALGKRLPAPNPAQGSSGNGPAAASQLTEADLKNMTPEQIVTARNEGRLTSLGYGVSKH